MIKIQCFTEDGKPTEQRNPIPSQQAEAYTRMKLQTQAEQAQELQQLNQSMAQFNNSIVANTPQYNGMYIPPQPQYGSNQIRCISTDIYTNCRSY
jgi:hypothetical protein